MLLTMDAVNALGQSSEEQVKKLPTHHAIILARNDVGRVNLYRLISMSHLKYYAGNSQEFPKASS